MGRYTLAQAQGWLDTATPLPDDAALTAAIGSSARRARSTVSSAEPHRARIEHWVDECVSGTVIHAALCRDYGYTGSYSAVHRLIKSIRRATPPDVTVPLSFAPARPPRSTSAPVPFCRTPQAGCSSAPGAS